MIEMSPHILGHLTMPSGMIGIRLRASSFEVLRKAYRAHQRTLIKAELFESDIDRDCPAGQIVCDVLTACGNLPRRCSPLPECARAVLHRENMRPGRIARAHAVVFNGDHPYAYGLHVSHFPDRPRVFSIEID